MELKFLQDARYDITEQIFDTLDVDGGWYDGSTAKIYFDVEVEDTTLKIELSVSIIDAQETLTLNN